MDVVHQERINANLKVLIEKTIYDPLIYTLERVDKNRVITERMMSQWKSRRGSGYSTEELNRELYLEIQRRGPHAFELLVNSLQSSGQVSLACILEPTISVEEAEDANEGVLKHMEYFSEEGTPYIYVDQSWEGDQCKKDREVLHNFFKMLGYQDYQGSSFDASAIIFINFCNISNGGVEREHDWVHKQFNDACFDTKPKILLSFRYKNVEKKSQAVVERDSGRIQRVYRDTIQIRIYVDSLRREQGMPSSEVKHLMEVFNADDDLCLVDKILALNRRYSHHKLDAVEKVDTDFGKKFKLKKTH